MKGVRGETMNSSSRSKSSTRTTSTTESPSLKSPSSTSKCAEHACHPRHAIITEALLTACLSRLTFSIPAPQLQPSRGFDGVR